MPNHEFPVRTLSADDVILISQRMSCCTSTEDLRDALKIALEPFGFIGFTFAAVRRVKSVYLHAEIVATWSASSQTRFQQHDLFNSDPVIIRSRVATEPFVWNFSIYDPDNSVHQQLLALRQSAGVKGGICTPIAEAFQGRSVLYLSGTDFDSSAETVLKLQLLAQNFAARAYAIGGNGMPVAMQSSQNLKSGELSPRERQVFGWIAFGKSSREVATIMSISEHTVNDHITSCMVKMNASNRTEAVLRALLTNQLDLS
jgi:LuxR family transcriptional regulator, quorum-sensing system regulator BjaR1